MGCSTPSTAGVLCVPFPEMPLFPGTEPWPGRLIRVAHSACTSGGEETHGKQLSFRGCRNMVLIRGGLWAPGQGACDADKGPGVTGCWHPAGGVGIAREKGGKAQGSKRGLGNGGMCGTQRPEHG